MTTLRGITSVLVLLCTASTAQAGRKWEKLVVPGARCGDGQPYSVFFSAGDPKRIALDLMGGGACWNTQTCWGPTPTTTIHPIPTVLEPGGFTSDDPARSPFTGMTMVYFPYCTGDIHQGAHSANYGLGATVHHEGTGNFHRGLELLQHSAKISLKDAEEMVLFGASAGALGALLQIPTVEAQLNPRARKTLIIDSPGLHFGDHAWNKFTPALVQDFGNGLAGIGIKLDTTNGLLAMEIPAFCRRYSQWKIGFLQGTRDLVMAAFGEITPAQHRELVVSGRGLYVQTEDPTDNCSTWIAETRVHTFLLSDATAAIKNSSGVSALAFTKGLMASAREGGTNSR